MNKYIFPGADASCSLGWVVNQVESAGFEVKNIDVLGVHYSATIYRWYKNWVSNKDKVIAAYGERWSTLRNTAEVLTSIHCKSKSFPARERSSLKPSIQTY